MAQQTFTWKPQAGYQINSEPDVSVVKFGDGYEQRIPKGINPLLDKYDLKFLGVDNLCHSRPNVAKQAEAFLRARKAVEAFLWTPPNLSAPILVVCRSWSMTKTHSVYELAATFEQVPA